MMPRNPKKHRLNTPSGALCCLLKLLKKVYFRMAIACFFLIENNITL
jgi:hypothetical protein